MTIRNKQNTKQEDKILEECAQAIYQKKIKLPPPRQAVNGVAYQRIVSVGLPADDHDPLNTGLLALCQKSNMKPGEYLRYLLQREIIRLNRKQTAANN